MTSKRRDADPSNPPDHLYEGLARRYRPQTFADVIGQTHVVRTLSQAITARRWAAAYLFIGGRGLGKTTMARILAKSINCDEGPTVTPCGVCAHCRDIASGRDIDVIEIDAASNTGVDNVREVIIQAASTSSARARCKIFIIDETHQLSIPAFNALLKTIEEPPSHVLFILATTDGHRVPATIRSRCQRFDFRPVSPEELGGRLRLIAEKEAIEIDDASIALLTTHAEGGVRDALSALDLIRSFAADKITLGATEEALGVIPRTAIEDLVRSIAEGNSCAAIERLHQLDHSGADPGEVLRGLLMNCRAALLADLQGRPGVFSRGRLIRGIEAILGSMERQRHARFPWIEMEALLARLASIGDEETSLKDLYSRLLLLERGEAPPELFASQPSARPAKPPAHDSAGPGKSAAAAKSAVPGAGGRAGANVLGGDRMSQNAEGAASPPAAKPRSPETAPPRGTTDAPSRKTDAPDEEIAKLRRIFKSSRIEVVK